MLPQSLATIAILHALVARGVATDITTYTDSECRTSQDNINGPNGYPDGTCTMLRERTTSNYSSFQVVGLDPGCGVTIYGRNSDSQSCSSTTLQIADVAHCYNTSWVYYSIDNCTPPDEIPSSTSTASATSSASSNNTNTSPTGAIVGGVVGGVAGLAVIIGAFLFFRRRRNRNLTRGEQDTPREQQQPPQELPPEARAELQGGAESEPKFELASKSKPSELVDARSPAEMEGDMRFPPPTS